MATVNRVLGGAGNVREDTGRTVAEAARRIGYHAVNLIEQRLMPQLPVLRLGIVLHKEKQEFYQNFASELRDAAARFTGAQCDVVLEFSHSQAPNDVAQHILSMQGRVDVVAATAVNHPLITNAVQTLKGQGIETFSLLSDFAQGERVNYLGLNNLKVGRGAAKMLSVAARKPGKIAIFVGGYRWHGHDLRETGFRGFFRETPSDFEILDALVNLETRQLTHEATLDLLERHPDVTGIYVAGGGMEGAIAALRELRAPGEVALVVNELTQESQFAMVDGYVTLINETPLRELSRRLVELMVNSLDDSFAVPGQTFLRSVLHLPEFDN